MLLVKVYKFLVKGIFNLKELMSVI